MTHFHEKRKAMDSIDRKILNLLQQNSRLSIKTISDALFITPPAISQRIKHLEQMKFITDYQAKIDFEKADLPIKAFIHLSLEPKQKPEFYDYIQTIRYVLECNCVTGPYSMLLTVVFPSTKKLDSFINEIQHFGRTQTQIVFSTPVPSRGFYFNDDES